MAIVLDEEKIKNILRQVEFYFSDSNLPRDKFLRSTVEQSEDGLVSLALICSFARMRSHLGLGSVKSSDISEETVLAVAEVLRKSSSLKVSEDGKKIGRSTLLFKPEEVIEQVDSRTVAASPFPYDVKIEDVQTFFGQKGKVNSVRLPRNFCDSRVFGGIALIEFSEEDEAKNALKEKLVYAGVDLELKPKNAFDAERLEKKEEFKRNHSNKDSSTRRNDERENKTKEARGSYDSSMESYPKGLIVAFKLIPMPVMASEKQNDSEIIKDEEVNNAEVSKSCETAKSTEDIEIKVKSSESAGEEEEKGNAHGNDIENEERVAAEEKPSEDVAGKGDAQGNDIESEENATTGSSENIESKAENDLPTDVGDKARGSAIVVTREDLKNVFQKFGIVKFIDYSMGQESGYIRFDDPDAAVKARAVSVLNKEGGLVVKKKYIATLDPVTGEAEKDYWTLLRANKDKHRDNSGYRGRGRHGRGGGRHYDGKRSRDFHAAKGRPSKAPKLADD